MPNFVVTIGRTAAFASCSRFLSIKLPCSIYNIEKETFLDCASLISINIPPIISIIQNMTFLECPSLQTILIPNSVTSIEYGAFDMCTNLKHIKLPPSITDISFYFCALQEFKPINAIIINPNTISTIVVHTNHVSVVEALKKASFFPFKHHDVLEGNYNRIDPNGAYFHWKVYACIKDKYEHLTLSDGSRTHLAEDWAETTGESKYGRLNGLHNDPGVRGMGSFIMMIQ